MPGDQDKASENPYEPSSVADTQGEAQANQPKARTLATSVGLGAVVFLASSVAFGATCTVGAIVGANVSATGPRGAEQAMGYGLMTGIAVGVACSLTVAVLLTRVLFRHRQEGS